MKTRLFSLALLFLLSCFSVSFVLAQSADVATDEPIVHIVQPGDTLSYIASQYSTTIAVIAQINGIPETAGLFVNESLTVTGVVPLSDDMILIDNESLLNDPSLPSIPKYHIVQGGESLSLLAEQYGITVDSIRWANALGDESIIFLGQELLIPDNVGELFQVEYIVQAGDTLAGLVDQFQTSPESLFGSADVVNPHYLVIGETLPIISRTGHREPVEKLGLSHVVESGETLSMIASKYRLPVLTIAQENGLSMTDAVIAGQPLYIPQGDAVYRNLAGAWQEISLNPAEIFQGQTLRVVTLAEQVDNPYGRLQYIARSLPASPFYYDSYEIEFPLHDNDENWMGLVGIDAFTPPGLYQLSLYETADASAPSFEQTLEIRENARDLQEIAASDSEAREPEDIVLTEIYSQITPEKQWDEETLFRCPMPSGFPTAGYGGPRSYNGAPVSIFHTGVDFAAPVDTPILAAAGGTVVYSNEMILRGNIVIIDHGWGVMSGYFHMNTRSVQVGDVITANRLIGSLGNTGLSTGPHLHLDVRIQNVPVDGSDWILEICPP